MKRKRKNFFKNIKSFKKFTKCYSIAQVEAQPRDPIQKPVISGLDKLPFQWKILSKIIELSKRTFSTVHKQETMGEEKQSNKKNFDSVLLRGMLVSEWKRHNYKLNSQMDKAFPM